MKSGYFQRLGWETRADMHKHNTGNMPMNLSVQYAQRKGHVCRDVTRNNRPKKPDGPRPVESVEQHSILRSITLPRR